MTAECDVELLGSEPRDGGTAVQVCGVCGHTRSSHDAIARRYCQASHDCALDRICVCTIRAVIDETANEHAGSTTRRSDAPMYGRGRLS